MPLPKISLKINEGIAQAINIDCRDLIYQPLHKNNPINRRRIRTDKSNPYARRSNPGIRKIKLIQFIDIFKKVGLMNQTPTEEKPIRMNQNHTQEDQIQT